MSEHDLRQFVAGRLAFFKIPVRVFFPERLPTGPTGKLQRLGLAEHLGLVEGETADRPNCPSASIRSIQRELAALWCATLGVEQVGLHDNFFVLGGDSISFVEILYHVSQRFGVDIPAQSLVQSPTIAGLCEKLQSRPRPVSDHTPAPVVADRRPGATRTERHLTPTERQLMAIWKELLLVQPGSVQDNFFELGGEAVPIARLFERIRAAFGADLPVRALLESPTIESLARTVDAARPAGALLVPLQQAGSKTPLFAIHDGGGYFFYWGLASRIGSDRPFYTVQGDSHLNGWSRPYSSSPSIEQLSRRYIQEIQTVQPHGPYHLAGASFGGVVAFEMARQLRAQGQDVHSLFLLSSFVWNNPFATQPRAVWVGYSIRQRLARQLAHVRRLEAREATRYVGGKLAAQLRQMTSLHRSLRTKAGAVVADIKWRWAALRQLPVAPKLIHDRYLHASRALLARYTPGRYDGKVVLLRGTGEPDAAPCWEGLAGGGLDVHSLPGRHMEMTREPHVDVLAGIMRNYLDAADANVERALAADPIDMPVARAG